MPLPPTLRALARSRALSLTVVAMLAVGSCALVTTFCLVDATLFRAPPFDQASRLTLLFINRASATEPSHLERWSYPRVQFIRQRPPTTSFETVANYTGANVTVTGPEGAESINGEFIAPDYFTALQARAAIGRTFAPGDDDASGAAPPVAILSNELWRRRYAADSAIVGRAIGINGMQFTVVGVMQRDFRGVTDRALLWVPATMSPRTSYPEYLTTNQNFISVVARLKSGATIAQADAEMRTLGAQADHALPRRGTPDSTETAVGTAVPLNEARVDPTMRRSLYIFFAAVALLHLLACANVANLLLGRAAARARESAVRVALGCSPARLLAHQLAEDAVLVLAGTALGATLALWFVALTPIPTDVWGARNFYGAIGAFAEPAFDLRAVAFAALVGLGTFGFIAAVQTPSVLRAALLTGLREGARGASAAHGTFRRPSARGMIVALEAALATVLLVAGSLMMQSFARMRATKLGIEPSHVLTFWIRPPEVRVPPAVAPAYVARILDAIARAPGVVSATVDGGSPLSGSASSSLRVVGRPEPARGEAPGVLRHCVGPDHFATLGIPIIAGRGFAATDVAGRPRVAVISQLAARRFWPNEDPIGQRVYFGGGSPFDRPDSSAEIVGIVGDVAQQALDRNPFQPDFYTAYMQFTYSSRAVFVKTVGPPEASVDAVRRAVQSVDPELALTEVQTLDHLIGNSWARHRFDAWLYGIFGAMALLLAASGIYAVVAYAVGQRTREMGIRIALGAQPAMVVRMVVREGLSFPIVGLAVGFASSLGLARILRASLYETAPTDPAIYSATIVALLAAATIACLIPARHATRVDPLVALRAD